MRGIQTAVLDVTGQEMSLARATRAANPDERPAASFVESLEEALARIVFCDTGTGNLCDGVLGPQCYPQFLLL